MNYYNFSFLMIFLLGTLIYLPIIFVDNRSSLAEAEESSDEESSDEESSDEESSDEESSDEESSDEESSDEESSDEESSDEESSDEESDNNNDEFLKESEDPITKYFGGTSPPEGGTP